MRSLADTAVLEDVIARMARLSPGDVRQWGSMNAQQMARHVADASAAVLKQREFASKARGGPSAVRRFVLLNVLPRMPRGIKSGAKPAETVVDPAAFVVDRDRAITLLRELATARPDALAERHPIFGPMKRAHWMRWAYMHTDHHLRQFGR
jgi:hypothetical protein